MNEKKMTYIRWAPKTFDAPRILRLVSNYGCNNCDLETTQVNYENDVQWEITIEVKRLPVRVPYETIDRSTR